MPQNAFFLRQTRDLLVSPKKRRKDTFFSTLHPLSTVIFAAATVLAFVLLRDSRLIFYCYTQCEATPTQKSARKCAATSRDFSVARKITKRIHSSKTSLAESPNSTSNKLLLVARHILTTGLQKCLYSWQCKIPRFTVTAFHCEESTHRK